MIFPYRPHVHQPPVPGAPALEVQDLCLAYPRAGGLAIRDLNLQIPQGSRVALVGANGAGKSTLLKALAGLLTPEYGTIRVYGQAQGACPHRVAYLPQRSSLDWEFPISVRKLVTTGRYVHLGWLKRPTPLDRKIVDETLEELGILHLADRQIGELSGGQQQRALLARTLAQQAGIILLDEPLNAVDAATIEVISRVMKDLKDRHLTVVAATHDLGRLEKDFDGAVYLHEGREVPPPGGSFHGLSFGQSWAKEGI